MPKFHFHAVTTTLRHALKKHAATTLVALCSASGEIAWGQPYSSLGQSADRSQHERFVTPPSLLAAQSTAPSLTLADAESIALRQNPALARAVAAVEAARGNWLQAGLPPNPTIGVGEQQVGSDGRAEQDFVAFSQEFVRGGKLRLNREVAANRIAVAEQELAAAETRVLTDTRVAFYTTMIAQLQRQVAEELVAIARLGVRTAEEANRGDAVQRNDVLEARIELRTAEIAARNSVNRHQAAWRSLSAVMGHQTLPLRELTANVEAVGQERDWLAELKRLQAHSPEIAAAIFEIERSRAAWRRACVEGKPNVTVDALVNWRDNGIGGDPDGGIQVSIPLPVWNRNQGAIHEAASEIAVAEHDLERLSLSLQDRLTGVFERYANAHFQVRQYRDFILPDAREALRLTRENYRTGQVEYDDLLTSQRTNAQANLEYLSALRELWTAEVEIEGCLLQGSLENR